MHKSVEPLPLVLPPNKEKTCRVVHPSYALQILMHSMFANGALLDLTRAFEAAWKTIPSDMISATASGLCIILAITIFVMTRKRPVFLCDFYCFHPPEELGTDVPGFVNGLRLSKIWTEQSCDFMEKVTSGSGLGKQKARSQVYLN